MFPCPYIVTKSTQFRLACCHLSGSCDPPWDLPLPSPYVRDGAGYSLRVDVTLTRVACGVTWWRRIAPLFVHLRPIWGRWLLSAERVMLLGRWFRPFLCDDAAWPWRSPLVRGHYLISSCTALTLQDFFLLITRLHISGLSSLHTLVGRFISTFTLLFWHSYTSTWTRFSWLDNSCLLFIHFFFICFPLLYMGIFSLYTSYQLNLPTHLHRYLWEWFILLDISQMMTDQLTSYLLFAGAAIGPLGFTVSAPGKDAFYSRPLPWIPSYHHNTMLLIGESVWDLVCSPSFYYALYMLYSFLLISTHSGNLFLS